MRGPAATTIRTAVLSTVLMVVAAATAGCTDDTTTTNPAAPTTTTTRVSGSGAGSGERMAANLAACFGANRPTSWTILDDNNVSVPADTMSDVATRSGFVPANSKDPAVTAQFEVNFDKNCRITSSRADDGTYHLQVFRDADGYAPTAPVS